MKIEQITITKIIADEGKILKRKGDGHFYGTEVTLGYNYYEAGVAPVGFDLTDYIVAGQENVIAVATDNAASRGASFNTQETKPESCSRMFPPFSFPQSPCRLSS